MRTILLVESDLNHLRRLERWIESDVLEKYDIQTLVATNYEEGRKWIKKNHIDVPIFDISLTIEDDELGLRLAHLYRQKYKYHTIFFQTAKNDPIYQNNVHDELGSVVYLSKAELIKDKFLAKLCHELERLKQTFVGVHFIKQHDKMIRIDPHRTLYFEKVIGAHMVKHCYYDPMTCDIRIDTLSSTSLNKVGLLLDANVYLRTHQSFIVNRNVITGTKVNGSNHMIQIQHTEIEIPISRGHLKKVESHLKGLPSNK